MPRSTLLLVDGDARNLRVLEVSLRKAGYSVVAADSGEDALDKVGKAHPALIISDTQLPGIDGYDFCKTLKEDSRWERVPFIFLTHQEAIEEKIRGLELGVEEYLTKPIFIKELLIRLKMVLQKKEREVFTDQNGQTTFKGNLADMAVVDLIQTMELGRKSGVAQLLRGEDQGAAIYFRDGKIIDAVEGDTQGETAIYSLLGWTDGSFVVEFQDVEREEVITESNQGLLMEGLRQVDEWNRIRSVLPNRDVALVQDPERADSLRGELSPMQSMALALTDGYRTIEDINGALAMDDLEILSAVRQLAEMGVIYDPAGGKLGGSGALDEGTPDPQESGITLADNPQPTAYGDPVGLSTQNDPEPEQPPPLNEDEEFSDEDEEPRLSRNTQPLEHALQLPADYVETKAAEQAATLVDLPPEEMEEDGEEPPPIPHDSVEIAAEADESMPPIPQDTGEAEAEADEEMPPIPQDSGEIAAEADEEMPPIPQDSGEIGGVDEGMETTEFPALGVDERAETAKFSIPDEDEDEEAAAIEDEEPPAQITAALSENTAELAGELTLLKSKEIAAEGEPVYLLTPPSDQEGDAGAEPEAEEPQKKKQRKTEGSQAVSSSAATKKASRKKKGRKKGKRSKKTKKGRSLEAQKGHVIPFPAKPADEMPERVGAGPSGGAELAPSISIAEAAMEAAARAGEEDPSEVSINVRDEEFFNSDYMGDDLAAFDESLIVPAGPPPKWRAPALGFAGVGLIGIGITVYFLATSPYIGDGPEHLRVDPASVAKQEEARRIADDKRRAAADKEEEAFLAGKSNTPGGEAPAPSPAPGEEKPPPAEPDAKTTVAVTAPAAAPDSAVTKTEPDKSPPLTAKPTPPPAPVPAADDGAEYAQLLEAAKALMKKRKKRQAIKKFKAAVKANPDGWEALQELALYNMELGRMGTAYKLAKKVVTLKPDAPFAHLVIGGMMQEKGSRGAARRSYSKFLKLCPRCRYARDIRAVLKSM